MASADDIAKGLEELIGANDPESTVSIFLSTGYPELDYALSSRWNGGLPSGRITEISGPPSAGKTAIATEVMAAAQRMGGIAGFCDHERSFSMALAPRLNLNTRPGLFVYKTPRTFEESITVCVKAAAYVREKKLIPEEAPIAWVFDSLASMVPMSALYDQKSGEEKSAKDRSMHDNTALARATSAHMPAFAMHCSELNICAIFLNQVRNKLGVMYGDPRTTPGGEAPKFYASTRIMLGASKITKASGGETIGSEITAAIIKNKVARPFLSAKWRFVYEPDGTGKFDKVRSTIDFLVREKALEKSGTRIVWKEHKFFADELARHIETKGEWNDLLSLLPKKYEPEVVAIEE
jgi:recombination protein RecA